MRRKSERNKTKGSPEKKVEKPTRKSARRRGKRATSSSPERDDSQEDTTSDASLSRESNKDSTRVQPKDLKPATEITDTVIVTPDAEAKDSSPETEDNGSVWKVARADASPGEIQKLKLCRQRNISETSDNSTSRKKSHKWQGSGEGVAEEVDSNDERLNSPQVEFSDKRPDDTSFLSLGQDSNQEVSDYKETLPESTSANLSDDKPNIDMQGDTNEASCFILSTDIATEPIGISAEHISYGDIVVEAVSNLQEIAEEGEEIDNQEGQQQVIMDAEFVEQEKEHLDPVDKPSLHLDANDFQQNNDISQMQEEETIPIDVQVQSEEISEETSEVKEQVFSKDDTHQVPEQVSPEVESPPDEIVFNKEDCVTQQEKEEEISIFPVEIETVENDEGAPQRDQESPPQIDQETPPQRDQESPQKDEIISQKDAPNNSSSEEEGKIHSDSNSIDEAQMKVRSSIRESSRSNRRKHRTKYRESSYSDTPESEDDPSLERESKQPETPEEVELEPLSRDQDIYRDRSHSKSLEPTDTPSLLNNEQRHDQFEEDGEKNENTTNESPPTIISDAITSSQKPAKINLKRTFGTRSSLDELKSEESSLCSQVETNVVKANHTNENTEEKRVPKRRRWGTTLSTDSTIDFSVSTDSLKALVPGAKPLSITEVRLSKDNEEEQSREKHVASDSNGEYVVREETVSSKSEGPRKGDTKADNHMGSRRKISVVKDIPKSMLPNSPFIKSTNILLIKNLVRPFTLPQIKELLSRTGTIKENGFWMDRIKSKCFVEYSNEDQAFETRQALHGISWPMSNPKRLHVEYATNEDMNVARESSQDVPNSRKEDLSTDSWHHDWMREEKQSGVKVMVVREWDLGKEDGQQHLMKEREKKEMEKRRRHRSHTPITEIHLPAPARKFKKKEDEPPPAKLLDDLFRKTKATPCIYWLPLTNEQIVVKEEMRRQHMAEHARRLEEMRRAERNRDNRRRRSPRK